MLMYPSPLEGYPMDWIEELRQFRDKKDVIRIEKKDVFDYIKGPELIAFYKRLEELCELPQVPDYAPMPEESWTWLHIIPKKQHEIRKLTPHINHIYQEKKIDQVIDIGGGVGFLAQTLCNQYKHKVVSIDMNTEFQKTGIERHQKNAKDPSNKVLFKNMKVEAGGEFAKLLSSNCFPIGLHTCGNLALEILRHSSEAKVPALVNFGCCYHTLTSEHQQNISEFARKAKPLVMTKFALTLSCRAHRKMDEKDYDLKQKVKFYRYAIHILLHDHYDMKKLVTLGNSNPKLYDESFGVYVYDQLKRVSVGPKHSIEELNAWYANPELTKLIERMLAAGLIRNALGRAMELYLLLDRAIYLEERGYKVQVQEFFDEELSPRNIGITAEL